MEARSEDEAGRRRIGLTALVLVLGLGPGSGDGARQEPLVPGATLRRMEGVANEIARVGDADLVAAMRSALLALGDDPDGLARLEPAWQKSLADAKEAPARERERVAGKLRREASALAARLPELDEARRAELAQAILALHSDEGAANTALGHHRDENGNWTSAERAAWKRGTERAGALMDAARKLPIDVEHRSSQNAALVKLYGRANQVGSHGIDLHSRMEPERLQRILTQTLRAIAFSNGLLHGTVEVPQLKPRDFVLLENNADYRPALDDARARSGLSDQEYEEIVALDLGAFLDRRGWRTAGFSIEANHEALLLWDMAADWMGRDVQPCLSAGHVNGVCLAFFGTSIPSAVWREELGGGGDSQRTVTRRDDAFYRQWLLRCARRSLFGCRAWMARQVRDGQDPPWVRSMLDHQGQITDELLLKTTLVCQMLQEEDALWPLVDATRKRTDRAAAIAAALGEPLPALEERWRQWILPGAGGGIAQRLVGGQVPTAADPRATAARTALFRARTAALEDQQPEIQTLELDPELSRAAAAHAAYLVRNPEQQTRWPDAHEEYADRPGFSPAGAMAASRSVIAFRVAPEKAVQDWLGSFYHRLPLLHPGLFGIGWGEDEGVMVLDASSLVVDLWKDHEVLWPAPDALAVPRAFAPEIPNPLPGVELADLGYPITVQLFFRDQRAKVAMEMALFEGADLAPENSVPCWYLTPDAPRFANLAPENAWCLIPEKTLKARTRYTVHASWGSRTCTWGFTTGS